MIADLDDPIDLVSLSSVALCLYLPSLHLLSDRVYVCMSL